MQKQKATVKVELSQEQLQLIWNSLDFIAKNYADQSKQAVELHDIPLKKFLWDKYCEYDILASEIRSYFQE